MDTNRWGRRREWENTPIRSSAPKVLSRLWEATCQRQTLMRFSRGWMLISFITKHVNIKGLQTQFSAVKKMPFSWLRGTGLPLWSGHQALAVVLTVCHHNCATCKPSPQRNVLAFSKGLWTALIPPSLSRPRLLWKENKYTGQEGIAELPWFPKHITDNSPVPVFLFLLPSSRPARTAPGMIPFFVTLFWVSNFQIYHCLGHQLLVWKVLLTNLIPFKGCRNYKCLDLC